MDPKKLYLLYRNQLRHIRKFRMFVRALTSVVYSMALCWFVFCVFAPGVLGKGDTEETGNITQYILIGFVVFFPLHYILVKALMKLGRKETRVMAGVLHGMFPEASYKPEGKIDRRLLSESRFFNASFTAQETESATCYGTVEMPCGGYRMLIADIGITTGRASGMYRLPVANYVFTLYRLLLRPIFGARIESSMHSFRGMFGCCETDMPFRSGAVLLPDHLEDRMGYLARHIQKYNQHNKAKLMRLEDPEFERHFAVYAEDETEARRVLTPLMMRRITAVRRLSGRDLSLSFSGNRLFYAAATPDGFLRPGRKSLRDEKLLEQLYADVSLCRTILSELRIQPSIQKI